MRVRKRRDTWVGIGSGVLFVVIASYAFLHWQAHMSSGETMLVAVGSFLLAFHAYALAARSQRMMDAFWCVVAGAAVLVVGVLAIMAAAFAGVF